MYESLIVLDTAADRRVLAPKEAERPHEAWRPPLMPPAARSALIALLNGPLSAKRLEAVACVVNARSLVASLRENYGLNIPCRNSEYRFSQDDLVKVICGAVLPLGDLYQAAVEKHGIPMMFKLRDELGLVLDPFDESTYPADRSPQTPSPPSEPASMWRAVWVWLRRSAANLRRPR